MVTMKDVAAVAGVSQAAVSYAYSRPDRLSARQRDHILQVARDLRYPGPNVVGSSLRSGRIGAIGVMVMDSLSYAFTDPSTSALLEGVVRDGLLDELTLTLIPLARRTYPSGRVAHDPAFDGRSALRGLVDGAILHSLPDDSPALRVLVRRAIPMVVVDSPRLDGIPLVGIEDRRAAQEQMSYLLDTGHRRVGVLVERLRPDGQRGPVTSARRELAVEHVVRERLAGYALACQEHAVDFDRVPVVEAGGFDRAAGLHGADELLGLDALTAVVATSDTMALATVEAAEGRGWTVPDDLSVIGFDDAPGAAEAGLTTVRQPMVDKGAIAAEMLLALLGGSTDVASVVLPHELVLRATTARPRS